MTLIVSTKNFLDETGNIARFTGRFFSMGIRPRYEIKEFLNQCYIIGYKSFPLIALTSFIMGLVLTMQLRPSLVSYGVESQLPVMVGLAIVREIGPVITALIFAGTHEKQGLSDILMGDNVKELIRDINFPLLLIPLKTVFKDIKKIGFAIELQNEDLDVAALHKLVRFAKPLKANIFLIHIHSGPEKKYAAENHLKRILKIVANMEDCPQVTSKLYDEETIEDGLNEVCESEGIDLLSMVHQHHSFLSRVFSSSHTGTMSDHIQIPLLVLPHEPDCVI